MMMDSSPRAPLMRRQPSSCETTLRLPSAKEQSVKKLMPSNTFDVHVTSKSADDKPSWNRGGKADWVWKQLGSLNSENAPPLGGRRSTSPLDRAVAVPGPGRGSKTPGSSSRGNTPSSRPVNSSSRIPTSSRSTRSRSNTPATNSSSAPKLRTFGGAKRSRRAVVTKSISIQCDLNEPSRVSPEPAQFEEPVIRHMDDVEKKEGSTSTEHEQHEQHEQHEAVHMLDMGLVGGCRVGQLRAIEDTEMDEFLALEASLNEGSGDASEQEDNDQAQDTDLSAFPAGFAQSLFGNAVSPNTRTHRAKMQQMRAARMHQEEKQLYEKDEENEYMVHSSRPVPQPRAHIVSSTAVWV